MKQKGLKGRKGAKGKETKGKYDVKFIEKVRMLVLQCGMINRRSEIAWSKIAQCLSVTTESIRRWRDPLEDTYKKEFAEAVAGLKTEVAVGKIKRDTVTASGRHLRFKKTYEAQTIAPKPPKAAYRKQELILYAKATLKLKLSESMTKSEMLFRITGEIEKQTKTKMVEVGKVVQEVYGEPAARALALANMGPVEDRWLAKETREHRAGGSLARLLEEIGSQETVLPSEELGLNDTKGTGNEPKEPVLEAEQPLLDNGSRGPTDQIQDE